MAEKIALVTDTHFGARNDSVQFNDYFFRFWEEIFFPYLEQHQIKTIVHLGDMFDRRKFINHFIANQVRLRFLEPIKDRGITCHIIIGNHDVYFKNTNVFSSVQNLCRGYSNIHIYHSPQVVTIDGKPLLFLPWICEENEKQSFQLIEQYPTDTILGHLQISGFEMDRGNVCHDGISRDVFSQYTRVLSGHFHHRASRGNIHYLGNPYELNWGEYDDPKGFHIFTPTTGSIQFIPNPHLMFSKYFYDDGNLTEESVMQYNWEQYKDRCVKVVVKSKPSPHLFDTVLDNIYSQHPFDVSVVENYLAQDELTADQLQQSIDQAEDTLTIMNRYIDGLKMELEKNKLKSLMSELYKEALDIQLHS